MYIKIDQKNTKITNTLSVCLPHPLTHRTSTPPSPGRLPVIPGTDKSCPDGKLLYTKVFHPGNRYRYRELPADGPEGGVSMFGVLGGVVDERTAYY